MGDRLENPNLCFTLCQKPWGCRPARHPDDTQDLCVRLHKRWHDLRRAVERRLGLTEIQTTCVPLPRGTRGPPEYTPLNVSELLEPSCLAARWLRAMYASVIPVTRSCIKAAPRSKPLNPKIMYLFDTVSCWHIPPQLLVSTPRFAVPELEEPAPHTAAPHS